MARLTILLVALIAAMATAFAPVPLSRTGEFNFWGGGSYIIDFRVVEEGCRGAGGAGQRLCMFGCPNNGLLDCVVMMLIILWCYRTDGSAIFCAHHVHLNWFTM